MCMNEVEVVFYFFVVEFLFKMGVKVYEIGVLVVNCSMFCFILFLLVMVVNYFGLWENIEMYNLGGMGCSVGVIVISFV